MKVKKRKRCREIGQPKNSKFNTWNETENYAFLLNSYKAPKNNEELKSAKRKQQFLKEENILIFFLRICDKRSKKHDNVK